MTFAVLLDPGLIGIALLGVGLGWLTKRRSSVSRRALFLTWAAWAFLWIAACPLTAALLAEAVEADPVDHAPAVADVPEAERAIVVLGGGIRRNGVDRPPAERLSIGSASRAIGAADVYRRTPARIVIVSGTIHAGTEKDMVQGMADLMIGQGVPAERIWLEHWSRSTRENAKLSMKMLEGQGIRKVIVVTSALHLPRAMLEFDAVGADAVGAPVGYEGLSPRSVSGLLPQSGALYKTHRVLHELLGRNKPTWANRSERWGGGLPPEYDPANPPRPHQVTDTP